MTNFTESNSGTTSVREGYELDLNVLTDWMSQNVEGFEGPITLKQFKGGQSNPTYKIVTPAKNYVLRRKPFGQTVGKAHAVDREARVMLALENTNVPVPKIYALCADESVLGSLFFIMDMVDGRIFWDNTFPGVSNADRPAYFDAMNETIAALHQVDYEAVGLGTYGKPGNYFARQIKLWTKQYLADETAGRNDDMDQLIKWLPENIPVGEETCLTHGDMRCDNMIFHPTEPKVIAVLDWELSTLGHPLADFAYQAMMYHMPPEILPGLKGLDIEGLNIPSEENYVAAYCKRTGRERILNWDFYMAFQFFRIAAIFHGIKGRVIRGTAANAQAKERAKAFPRLAQLAVTAMDRCTKG